VMSAVVLGATVLVGIVMRAVVARFMVLGPIVAWCVVGGAITMWGMRVGASPVRAVRLVLERVRPPATGVRAGTIGVVLLPCLVTGGRTGDIAAKGSSAAHGTAVCFDPQVVVGRIGVEVPHPQPATGRPGIGGEAAVTPWPAGAVEGRSAIWRRRGVSSRAGLTAA
jgi:hypothetical protein